MRLGLALLLLGCAQDPLTFYPPRDNWQGCHAMRGDLFGCTLSDGHHTLWFGVNEPLLVGGPRVLSDCGGTWHEVTADVAAERCAP